jgi:NAD-dependent deacetylase
MKNLVVLSGAGISAESGFSTFRDSGGYWDKYPVEQVATPEGWRRNMGLVNNFYNMLRKQQFEVSPNDGHKFVSQLEKYFHVTVVTQNVDNLHEQAGSSQVIHLHGELDKVCSSRNPDDPRCIRKLMRNEYEVTIGDKAPDGSQYRPYIVWFGEAVPKMEDAIAAAKKADIFLIIGTSLNVYPAAGLLNYVPEGADIYLIDPKEVKVSSDRHVTVIRKKASEGMKELTEQLLAKYS